MRVLIGIDKRYRPVVLWHTKFITINNETVGQGRGGRATQGMQVKSASVRLRPVRARGLGLLLTILALYVQLLLPYIVALESRVAEVGNTGLADVPICHLSISDNAGNHGTPANTGDEASRCCPLCMALSVGTAFMAPAEPYVSVLRAWISIHEEAANERASGYVTTVHYEARGPPQNS